ncbi:MarR family winged helix-turn-helix transcriptional regulator [Limimaricola pyoseonensis]|uniref:DNA-binding transcriptional regulator, MarR family n=1 Tax=Limimaricola pyoseonensis TaxID=521013 RepID=A0A1G7JHS4_9RHOB|nr:MarR family winged helix-turn-helix transcriptional regulator [Limimaricola pyoseonensis]SDF24461.1 DNA-binding transcriptional regulator, MarR family [Limimaricola pyoseonensis]
MTGDDETEGAAPADGETSPRRGYALDGQIGYLLRRAQQRHLSIFHTHMAEGLTAQQFAVLAKLSEIGETSQNALGRQTSMDQSTINGVVQRMVKRGLISKKRSSTDARMIGLDLTREGRRVLARVLPLASEITQLTLAPLSEKDQQRLLKLLNKIS